MHEPSDGVMEQALAWHARLASGFVARDELCRFEQWRVADPRHDQAWRYLERLVRQLSDAQGVFSRVMASPAELDRQRRHGILSMILLAIVVVAGVGAQHLLAW